MGDCSPGEFMVRVERGRPKRGSQFVDRAEVEELEAKLLKITNRSYHYASQKTKKQLRAENGNKDLKRFLK